MADHVRKQIRDAVVLAITGLATTGANVFAEKTSPIEVTALPALSFSSKSDTAENDPGRVEVGKFGRTPHEYVFEIQGHAKQGAGVEDTLDAISKEVTVALASGITVAGAIRYPLYAGEDFDFSGDSEQPVGTLSILWSMNYYVKTNQPDVWA